MYEDSHMNEIIRIAREGAAMAKPGFYIESGRGFNAVRVYTGFTPCGKQIVHEFFPISNNYKELSEIFPGAILTGCPFFWRDAPGWKCNNDGGVQYY
jgi:hypothetical protein